MAEAADTARQRRGLEGILGEAWGLDLAAVARYGAISGLTAVLVSATGIVQAFAERKLIDPVTLGYVLLALVPFGLGYRVGNAAAVRPGAEASPRRPASAVAGTLMGLLTGAMLAVGIALVSEVNVRSVLQNVSPELIDTLTFNRGTAAGIGWLVLLTTLVGAAGGSLNLISKRWRRSVTMAVVWVLMFALLQVLIAQIFRGIELSFVNDFLYDGASGMSIAGAVVVFALAFGLYFWLGDKRIPAGWSIAGGTREERRRGLLVLAIGAALLAVAPMILGNFLSEVADLAGVYLLMALGLNIVVGYAGLLDLGYVAFFAVGAYTAAVLTSPASPRWSPELTFWTAIPFVVLAAALAGVIVGTPVIRMRGDYLAIVTLGFGEIARLMFLSDALKPTFGGAQGIINIPNISAGPVEVVRSDEFFYLIYGFAAVLAYASWALQESRIGRAWMALREDETVAEATGVNVVQAKLTAFIIGAIFASLGGALFAHKIGSIFPHSFAILVSITVLMIVIVGGMGSIPGVMLAALVLVGLPELLREFAEYRFLVYGALLIFMMLNKPEGFIPSKQRSRELHEDEAAQDAWLRRDAEAEARAGAAAG